MQAVVFKGPYEVAVEEVPDPRLEHSRDALVRITSAAICGTDLHIYEGRTAAEPGQILGHEPMGVVTEVGEAVVSIRPGDRVAVTFSVACGHCLNCLRGWPNTCLTINREAPASAFGMGRPGDFSGGQAECMRVPFADFNLIKLPGSEDDEWEDDFVMLADIFPTGYHAAELAQVGPGSSVAVFGAGPVGLMSVLSAVIKGASEVYAVDFIPERLAKAAELGAIPVDAGEGDPVHRIVAARVDNPPLAGSLLPGEENMHGVLCGIDAVGYQARDRSDPSKENPTQVIDDLVRLLMPTGHLSLIGVYQLNDPGGRDTAAREGSFLLPLGKIWAKRLTIGTGSTPVKRYAHLLRELIVTGRARPGRIVSHHYPLARAAEAYRLFDERREGHVKVVLKPAPPPASEA